MEVGISLVLFDNSGVNADAWVGCLIILPIWEEQHLGRFITPTDPKFGTFSGPSTLCPTGLTLEIMIEGTSSRIS